MCSVKMYMWETAMSVSNFIHKRIDLSFDITDITTTS